MIITFVTCNVLIEKGMLFWLWITSPYSHITQEWLWKLSNSIFNMLYIEGGGGGGGERGLEPEIYIFSVLTLNLNTHMW